jgi:hypothetical protein
MTTLGHTYRRMLVQQYDPILHTQKMLKMFYLTIFNYLKHFVKGGFHRDDQKTGSISSLR